MPKPPSGHPFAKSAPESGMTVKQALERGVIQRVPGGTAKYTADCCGDTVFLTGGAALRAHTAHQRQLDAAALRDKVERWKAASLRAVREGEDVRLIYPNGIVLFTSLRTYRQNVFDWEKEFGSVEIIDEKDVPKDFFEKGQ